MSAILELSQFGQLESLEQFSSRYLHTSHLSDKILTNIWISHVNPNEIPEPENLPSCDHCELYKLISRNVNDGILVSDSIPYDVITLFEKILKEFKSYLTVYIFTKCNLFYNWGINSYEPIINQIEIHRQIKIAAKNEPIKRKRSNFDEFKKWRLKLTNCRLVTNNSDRNGPTTVTNNGKESPDLFLDSEENRHWLPKRKRRKYNSTQIQDIFHKSNESFKELPKNKSDPNQEVFNLNKVLYDEKQRPRWPKNHILELNSIHGLLKRIIDLRISASVDLQHELLSDSSNWKALKCILRTFLREHKKMSRNNGYGRILRHHLKNVLNDDSSDKNKPTTIPKTLVSSYVLCVLRKVLRIEFFGTNNTRRKFFDEIVRLVNGQKDENFTWHSLVIHMISRKSDLKWCDQMKDDFTRDRMILKTIKWIVDEYVFAILKNNFFITEIGSSDYGLKFYRKNEIERTTITALNDLLYRKKLGLLKSSEKDIFTIERKWIDLGKIDSYDIKKKYLKMMPKGTEYKQEVADVRFLPKNDYSNEVRMITKFRRKKMVFPKDDKKKRNLLKLFRERELKRSRRLEKVKLLLKFLAEEMGTGIKPLPNNPTLVTAWNKAVFLKQNFGKLYFVKADISDAFGSVIHSKLNEVISGHLSQISGDFIQLKKIKEWKLKNGKIILTNRTSFSGRPKENSILISSSDYVYQKKNVGKYRINHLIQILNQIVTKQRLRIKGKIYKLLQGLAQGSAGKHSPLLCEIYYSAMDRTYFKEFLSSNDAIFLRGVDDYLLITNDLSKATKFYQMVKSGISDFNARFSDKKLITNISEDIKEVPYLGLIFNVDNMTVLPNYSKYENKDLLSTMKLSDYSGDIHFRKTRFLEKRANNIVCLKLQPILLSNCFNSMTAIRKIIVQACAMQAKRVLVLSKRLYKSQTKNDLDICVILAKSLTRIISHVRRYNKNVQKEEISWLFYFGVFKVFKKFSGQFCDFLRLIRYQIDFWERRFVSRGERFFLECIKSDVA